MELDQWLVIYLTVAQSASQRRQTGWSLLARGAIAQTILAVAAIFLLFIEPLPMKGTYFLLIIGLVSIGLLMSLGWLMALRRLRVEASHFEGLVRGIESQFAGAEFFRSIHRLQAGEKVCTPASSWTCNEWLPSVSRLPILSGPRAGHPVCLMAWPFTLGWIGLLLLVLVS